MNHVVILARRLFVGVLLLPLLGAYGQSLDPMTTDVQWAEDGGALLVATLDTLSLYDTDDWEALPHRIPLELTVIRSIDILHDLVVVGSDTGVAVLDYRSGERVFYDDTLRGHAAFLGENQIAAGAFGISVVDIGDSERFRSFGSYYWPVSAFAVTADGRYAAATNLGEGGFLWEVETGEQIAALPDATDFAFSPDASQLAYSRMQNEVYLWDIAQNVILWQAIPHDGDGAISVAFRPDGAIIAAAYRDGTLVLCDAETGEMIDIIHAYDPSPDNAIVDYGLAYSPDGSLLASGGSDATVRIWDVSDGHFVSEPVVALVLE